MSEPKPKINFSLIKLLIGISGVVWLVVMFAFLNQVPDIHKVTDEEITAVIDASSAPVPDIETIQGKPLEGVNVAALGKPTDELLAKGEAAYKKTCASCHGDNGQGDGVAGSAMNPKPRNFHSADGWKNGRNFAAVYKTLEEGLPGTLMTAYEFLPVEERFAIIHYVRKIGGGFPDITDAELKQLDDTYGLSSPRLSASQIPVAMAEVKVIDENASFNEKLKKSLETLNSLPKEEKDRICSLMSDKSKAIATLLRDESWKSDFGVFQSLIADNTNANGFKPSAFRLSKEQLSELYGTLKSVIL